MASCCRGVFSARDAVVALDFGEKLSNRKRNRNEMMQRKQQNMEFKTNTWLYLKKSITSCRSKVNAPAVDTVITREL